jgi:DNA-binding NarL/FixJ family response regulator
MRWTRRAPSAVSTPSAPGTAGPAELVTQTADGTVGVLVVEDGVTARSRTIDSLASAAGLVVVGAVGTLAAARAQLRDAAADRVAVALVDVRLPDGNGLELCRELRARHPGLRVLIFTDHDDQASRLAAAVAGASGYLLKDAPASAVTDAVRDVAAGCSFLEAETAAARRLLGRGSFDHSVLGPLTDRERTVRVLLLRGHSDAAIARLLEVDERTVRADVAMLLTKLLTAPGRGRRRRLGAPLSAYLARVDRPDSAWM